MLIGQTKMNVELSRLFASVFLIVLIATPFLGIFDCTNPMMQSRMDSGHHALADCVPGKDCGMDLDTHLSIWQASFTADFSPSTLRLFQSLAVAVLWGIAAGMFTIFPSFLLANLVSYFLYYKRHSLASKLYNYFLQIFARGILQPKLYA